MMKEESEMIGIYDKMIEDELCKDHKSELEKLIESTLKSTLTHHPKMDEKEKKEQ